LNFSKIAAGIFVPDGAPVDEALRRTTHLAVGAHQDDLEIMALEGILAGFGRHDAWFTGVVVTSGAGSPRDGLYASYTDAEMQVVRRKEQKKASVIGEYAALVFLDYSSAEAKDPANGEVVTDLARVLEATAPGTVYAHNLADKHPTHVAVALRLIKAIRSLPAESRPTRLVGCEVWRDLDWMTDADKVIFRLDSHENIAASLVGVFDSQIIGGKRYDLATLGRRRAHATYLDSHAVDATQLVNFGMDLTPLIEDGGPAAASFVRAHIERFADEVEGAIAKLA
jgi:LmbE family N-acetylglucosaminyl deacetylase